MSNRKSIHFTSDWHLGHANSLKFDDRPFKDLNHMHRTLINNYNAHNPNMLDTKVTEDSVGPYTRMLLTNHEET